ncbi:N-acetylmuramidase domain-containing protein [Lysobacter sp. S4-A87]|uniref:N-acetylmuramidase domain-containing protein n=1 Tax=Lysobacter sp. S4-A87 TaxID=2925843 RepID=UPI001F5312C1|nr:N-acetylmuramidase domain-containing protein [Lysobacter sp. S4-A87]UNK50346.1 N-acetylmuramidase domain-containing protein [Lysobacter sp. S4-A87]
MEQKISREYWIRLAEALEVEPAALRAVAQVESNGSGFLPPPSERPKILFEGHAFHRLTGGRFDEQHPNLSYPRWDRSQYSGSLTGEWQRLEAACLLDRVSALQSASWGMFQIMGFNYSYAGFRDVDAFVAAHHAGAEEQVGAFGRFISRPPFLVALRRRNWARFAAAYNGPGYAKNNYDKKMAAAYAKFQGQDDKTVSREELEAAEAIAGRSSRRKTTGKADDALPPGRETFAVVQSTRRRNPRRRNVRPDPVDLRDWMYQPSIAIAPRDWMLPNDPRQTKHQHETNACTGFALATAIEYLLDRGQRAVEPISGYMLYSMARRYDEWADDDESDSGSSLRGVLKGWASHGASAGRLWTELDMPPATNTPGEDWWLDAVKRPMGAYYRISPENIRDMHIALAETGAIVASAFTHARWDLLLNDRPSPPPTTVNELPVISTLRGARDQGHAFAIVGYTREGFIIQNSWGPNWGRGGFAVLPYADWAENAMDCWVVQLGVVTAEHDAVARATSLRVEEKTGRALVSSDPTLGDHEISPFVVNMENEGRLSERGRFRTGSDDLRLLVDHHLPEACRVWGLGAQDAVDVAVYAHGGLTDENAAAKTARTWIPHLYSNRIFPVFLMWETGAWKTITNMFEDVTKGEAELVGGPRWDRFKQRFEDWRDERLEGLARPLGKKLWGEMKQNANAMSGTRDSGVIQLFEQFRKVAKGSLPRIRLHLIGHSAGGIVHSWLAPRALKQGFDLHTISLLAPAVRIDTFDRNIGASIAARKIRVLIGNLTDAAERADGTCSPYGHSLLYLVSRSFEDSEETPLLGMEKHLVPALATHAWGAMVRQLPSPGRIIAQGNAATRAITHGGMDEDDALQRAVVSFIRSN